MHVLERFNIMPPAIFTWQKCCLIVSRVITECVVLSETNFRNASVIASGEFLFAMLSSSNDGNGVKSRIRIDLLRVNRAP